MELFTSPTLRAKVINLNYGMKLENYWQKDYALVLRRCTISIMNVGSYGWKTVIHGSGSSNLHIQNLQKIELSKPKNRMHEAKPGTEEI